MFQTTCGITYTDLPCFVDNQLQLLYTNLLFTQSFKNLKWFNLLKIEVSPVYYIALSCLPGGVQHQFEAL